MPSQMLGRGRPAHLQLRPAADQMDQGGSVVSGAERILIEAQRVRELVVGNGVDLAAHIHDAAAAHEPADPPCARLVLRRLCHGQSLENLAIGRIRTTVQIEIQALARCRRPPVRVHVNGRVNLANVIIGLAPASSTACTSAANQCHSLNGPGQHVENLLMRPLASQNQLDRRRSVDLPHVVRVQDEKRDGSGRGRLEGPAGDEAERLEKGPVDHRIEAPRLMASRTWA